MNPKYDDFDMMGTFLLHFPAGASVKFGAHLCQLIRNVEEDMDPVLRKFDYGEELNFFYYGTTRPPGYDLGLAKVPMAMFYGDRDL